MGAPQFTSLLAAFLTAILCGGFGGCSPPNEAKNPTRQKAQDRDARPREAARGGSQPQDDEKTSEDTIASPAPPGSGEKSAQPWEERLFSPRPGSSPDPELEILQGRCGAGDQGLHRVAAWMASRRADEGVAPLAREVRFEIRRQGLPYVYPRLWFSKAETLEVALRPDDVRDWAQKRPLRGQARCGLGMAFDEEGEVIVSAVQVDVSADLAPLPSRVELGARVEFQATLLEPTTAASLLLLPPEGRPFSIETKVSDLEVTAELSLDREGTWLVQLMGTDTGGPRPLLELLITAESEPPAGPLSRPVPGEEAGKADREPTSSLLSMLNEARNQEGLPGVQRNASLDELARTHCQALVARGILAHDTGAGPPDRRVEAAGLEVKAVGENVARARSLALLHRTLWESPSHRENLLDRRWDQVGLAVVESPSGDLVAVQLFADDDSN